MEPLARLTLLGLVVPRGRRDGSFLAWNGSRASLPLVKPPSALPEATARRREVVYLTGEGYTAVLLLQSLVVLGVIGFLGERVLGEEDARHFQSWNL